jgi:tetratricopeptide (TPR) repeat protein
MKNYAVVGLLFLLMSLNSLAQQTSIEKARENFKNNKISESRRLFIETTKQDPTNAEAYLMLSLLATIDKTPDEALDYFIRFTEVTTEDINPYLRALWYSESVANGIKKKIDNHRVEFLTMLLESDRLNSTTRAYALETLGDHYKLSNNLKKSDEYFNKIGSVVNWQIVGEFDNVSGSGFDKLHDPIVFPQTSSIFTNKYQAPVHWFVMKEAQPGRWLDLEHHFIVDNSVIYAQTFCNSTTQQDVFIRIGTSGSLKTWINDKLLFSEADERNNGTDTYTFTARLNKGYNRILLQIGSSEIDRSNFLVRVTDHEGNVLEDLSYSSDYQPYETDKTDFTSEIIPNFAESYFISRIENEPENLANYILLSSAYLANDKTYQAQKTIQKAQKIAPDCSFVLLQLIEIYLRDDNRTELSMAIEKLKDIDPQNPLSLKLFYNEAINKKDYDEAESLINGIEKIFGRDEYVLSRKIGITAIQKEYESFNFLLGEAYDKFPDNSSFVYLKYLLEKEQNKKVIVAANVLKKYLAQNYNADINYYYATALVEAGQVEKGLSYLDRLVEFDPGAVGYYSYIGDIYFELRDYKTARTYYEKCIEIAPYIGSCHSNLGKTWIELNYSQKAITCYRDALKYDPNDYASREKLRNLEGKASVFSYFETPDFYQIYKESPNESEFPGEGSIILVEETQKVVYDEGGNQQKSYLLVKILNSEGIDDWKEYQIPVTRNQALVVEKAEVIKKNGSKVKAEINYDQIVFTSLEVGDAISLIYKLDIYESGKFMKHFTDECYFTYFIPAKILKYSLLISPNIKFNYLLTNSDMKPEISQKGDFTLYKWEKHDIAAIKYENYMPDMTDVGEILFLSSYPDWNFLSEWYADITNNQLKSDFFIQEKVQELFDGKDNLTEIEKAKVIYEYVTREIRYSSIPFRQSGFIPQKPSEVIATRMGDCKDVSTLFVALCREIGIDANIVLVNSRENGKNETLLPSFSFDHSIAQVKIGGEDYFIELTSDLFSFASLPPDTKKSMALTIKDANDSNVKPYCLDPPTQINNSINRNVMVEFENDKMIVKADSRKSGWHAASMRNAYKNISIEEKHKTMSSSISSDYANAELITLKFDESLQNSENEVTYYYEYLVNNIFTRINKIEIFRIPFTDNLTTDYFNFGNTRDYPLEYWRSYRCEDFSEHLTIKIPDGKQLAEIPENIDYQNKIARYQVTFKVENNVFTADRKLTFTDDVVSKEDYPAFKEFFTKVINADARQIAFQ